MDVPQFPSEIFQQLYHSRSSSDRLAAQTLLENWIKEDPRTLLHLIKIREYDLISSIKEEIKVDKLIVKEAFELLADPQSIDTGLKQISMTALDLAQELFEIFINSRERVMDSLMLREIVNLFAIRGHVSLVGQMLVNQTNRSLIEEAVLALAKANGDTEALLLNFDIEPRLMRRLVVIYLEHHNDQAVIHLLENLEYNGDEIFKLAIEQDCGGVVTWLIRREVITKVNLLKLALSTFAEKFNLEVVETLLEQHSYDQESLVDCVTKLRASAQPKVREFAEKLIKKHNLRLGFGSYLTGWLPF